MIWSDFYPDNLGTRLLNILVSVLPVGKLKSLHFLLSFNSLMYKNFPDYTMCTCIYLRIFFSIYVSICSYE